MREEVAARQAELVVGQVDDGPSVKTTVQVMDRAVERTSGRADEQH